MASSKKSGAAKKRISIVTPQAMLAEVVKAKGSARAVADEMKAAGYRSSQQSVDAWVKGHWPPRPATQDALNRLYKNPGAVARSPGMSDDSKSATPAPAPAPVSRVIESPMASYIRGGGTTTSAYETQLKKQAEDTKKAHDLEDSRRKAAEQSPDNAKQHRHVVGGNKAFPGIVLEVREPRDHKVLDYIECELTLQEDGTLALIIACWNCYLKTGRNEQLTIRQNHRKFELDIRRAGELWVDPNDHQHIVTLAGTIHLTEVTTCPVCAVRFVIDNSIVREL